MPKHVLLVCEWPGNCKQLTLFKTMSSLQSYSDLLFMGRKT